MSAADTSLPNPVPETLFLHSVRHLEKEEKEKKEPTPLQIHDKLSHSPLYSNSEMVKMRATAEDGEEGER